MKLRTRIALTFILIIAIPLILTIMSFTVIRAFLNSGDLSFSDGQSMQDVIQNVDGIYSELLAQKKQNEALLGDADFLQGIQKEMGKGTTFLFVRRGETILYSGNEALSERLLPMLPKYGQMSLTIDTGIWFDAEEVYIRQIDFADRAGNPCSLFVAAKGNNIISRRLVIDMLVAIIVILVVTSIALTAWINRGIYEPVKMLNEAMKSIRNGDYDYVLDSDEEGEIGDLFRNYEDMRMQLKESAREKSEQEQKNRELVSNISHDLKTPITSIKGYVEGIMDGVADTPEKMDRYIRTIYNKASDMDNLINELTTYSSVENDRIPYKFLRINVADYFGDCKEEVGMDLEARGIDFHYSNFAPPDTVIIADPEQMKKVINNIISNSVKYMDKPRGVIEMRILDEVDSVRMEIEDNGKGIAQKDLDKIFERFYRTDASRNSAQGGSGIGLSIVKKIIEDHGGYIWATGREGEGTCMHFVLRKYQEMGGTPS